MDIINFRRNFSRNTLFGMALLAIIVTLIIVTKMDSINTVYFQDQLTSLGLMINGAIVIVFLLGMFRIIILLLGYTLEENAISRYLKNQTINEKNKSKAKSKAKIIDALKGVSPKSLIAKRFFIMKRLHDSHTEVHQGALASTLIAGESTKISLPKFINNTLILFGVFGTIVSLSIALLGASDLLTDAVNVDGMGIVIHGMSTALSTTITAIICYLLLGYFYLKLTDAQTNLVSAIEQVTTHYFAPQFQFKADAVQYEVTDLVRSLKSLVEQMQVNQDVIGKVESHLVDTMESYHNRVDHLSEDMSHVIKLLRIGFRLKDEE